MLSSNFHCKGNGRTTEAAHLVLAFFFAISPDIRRVTSLANHRSQPLSCHFEQRAEAATLPS